MQSTLTKQRDQLREAVILKDEGLRLQRDMAEMGRVQRELADQLAQGKPPDVAVLERLRQNASSFEAWWDKVRQLLGHDDLEKNLPKALEALEAYRQRLEEAATCEVALGILERVSAIVHHGHEEMPTLTQLQMDVLDLVRSITQNPAVTPTVQSLAAGTHPYVRLVHFLQPQDMSDEEWEQTYQSLHQSLGREIAVAAARGRLQLV
ncbi:hypothetical protein Mterra_01628 [Calidithermus terrae]|uniref:Uncharacterized protein n=1 Tax=Calidithermus terrae TaxID=1408545 RepID=A0A399ERV5_9DEIN|nr:hypothetical protein [Calidithermus terrae]RIH85769.1 hypothetical protein Mterra_01628 [Calidithermus terrae]